MQSELIGIFSINSEHKTDSYEIILNFFVQFINNNEAVVVILLYHNV